MQEWLIKLGIFAAGCGVGVLGTRAYFDRKYKQIADEEIESCKARFAKKKEVVEKVEVKEDAKPVGTKAATTLYSVGDSKDVVDYKDYYKSDKVEGDKKLDDIKTLKPEEDEQFEISIEDFESDDEYSKVTLNYYTEDGMLIYEESEQIAIEESTIGAMNLDDFAAVPERSAYFRDPNNEVDYEVIKVDGSYRELIAGDI